MYAVLSYERGTILVKGDVTIPFGSWDPRAKAYRALALNYRDILEYFGRSGIRFEDHVMDPVPCPELRGGVKLRDYQQQALDAWLAAGKRGVIVLPTGAGKTVIGLKAIEAANVPAIVIVPTLDLVEQWRGRLAQEFNIEIGIYGGSEYIIKPITVSTYDSAYLRSEELGNRFPLVIFDECLASHTIIVLADGGVRTISNVRDGERVVGGTVEDKFSRTSNDVWTLRTSFTTLNCTGTHPHILVRRRRNRHLDQWHKITPNDIKLLPTNELQEGDMLLVPETIPHTKTRCWTADQLRFVGLIAADGHVDKKYNSIKVAVSAKSKTWVRSAFIKGITAYGHGRWWEFINKRGDYTIGCSSKSIKEKLLAFGVPAGKKSLTIDVTDEIFYSSKPAIAAFLDGVFSADGWVIRENNGVMRLELATISELFARKTQLLLKKLGIHSCIRRKRRRLEGHHDCFHVDIGGLDFNSAQKAISFSRPGLNREERNRGRYMNDRLIWENVSYRLTPVLEKRRIDEGPVEVFDFTSNGSHTFLANGVLTHNCHHAPAQGYSHIAEMFASPYRMGLTATYERPDGLHEELPRLVGGKVYELQPEALAGTHLSTYTLHKILIDLTPEELAEYGKYHAKFTEYLRTNNIIMRSQNDFHRFIMRTGRDKAAREALLARNRALEIALNSSAKIETLSKLLSENPAERILIFTQHNRLVYAISKKFLIPAITHRSGKEERAEILTNFKSGAYRVVVTSKVLDEGIDVPDATMGIILSGTGSTREFIQRLGRILRKREGKKARLIEIVSRQTSEVRISRRRMEKKLDAWR